MPSLLNKKRPPAFCPGCSHEIITRVLDKALQNMNLNGNQVVIVSDIGCSGLFDTFFSTHAFHGLHGRALTYATGIKLAQPKLKVIVTMGDGGLGIGGAHLLSTCRRNIDITLLILNNFNYGMTGGQFSSTTPQNAQVGSGFLNQVEKPMDVCRVLDAAGAGFVSRMSAYHKELSVEIERAVQFKGFSAIDIWGICPGRYTRQNKLTIKSIQDTIERLPAYNGPVEANIRTEYGQNYRETAVRQKPPEPPLQIAKQFSPPFSDRKEIVILGSAGQRIITAGEILCYAGLTAGLHATQKNDYPITVLRGHSVSEVVLSTKEIGYTGIDTPHAILAIGQEGIDRKSALFKKLNDRAVVIKDERVAIPDCRAEIITFDFKDQKIKAPDMALAGLAVLCGQRSIITGDMLQQALYLRFKDKILETALNLIHRINKHLDL